LTKSRCKWPSVTNLVNSLPCGIKILKIFFVLQSKKVRYGHEKTQFNQHKSTGLKAVFCVGSTGVELATRGTRHEENYWAGTKILILLQTDILKFHLKTVTKSYLHGCKKYVYISCILWLISFKMFARIRMEFTSPAVRKCAANILVLYSGLCSLCTLATETQNFKNCNKALFRLFSYIKHKNLFWNTFRNQSASKNIILELFGDTVRLNG
jgi:hypothetical protein